jgi:hypothetical protein
MLSAPVTAYLRRVHRSIHRLWGFGLLEDWDRRATPAALNDPTLLTILEIVLNGDGTVHRISVVQKSAYLPYDVAAIDAAYSAGPYPPPSPDVLSRDDKIYLHWRFYRDGRQCATAGVDYFVVDNAPWTAQQGDGGTDGRAD